MMSLPTLNYFANLTWSDGMSRLYLDEVTAVYRKYNPSCLYEFSSLSESVNEYLRFMAEDPCLSLRYSESLCLTHMFQHVLHNLEQLRAQVLLDSEKSFLNGIFTFMKCFMAWNRLYMGVEVSALLYLED